MPLRRRRLRTQSTDGSGTPAIGRLARRIHDTRARAKAAIEPRRKTFYSLVIASLVILCLAVWPFTKAHLQAVAVLDLVSGQPVPALIAKTVAQPVTTQDVTIQEGVGPIRARLYMPERGEHAPALIVLHGVHHLGMDEPRLMSFATAMASTGIRVLTPELPDIKDYRIDAESVRTIGETTEWFAHQTGGPVGVMGLSFSGGLSLVAAADPVYRPSFKFVFAVGSQDEMSRVADYYRTGTAERPDGSVERLPAHEYGALVFEYEHLADFVHPADLVPIRNVLQAHLYEDKPAEDAAMQHLTPGQRAQATQLMDSSSQATHKRLADAEASHIAEMEGLSPHGHLKTLNVPVYLLHGQADNIIPSVETLWMAQELPGRSLQAMLVSPVLSHLDLESAKPGAMDTWRLVHFFAIVLHATGTKDGRG